MEKRHPSEQGWGNLRIVGLLGGVGSGKSFVAKEFQRLGATVFDADAAGHETLREPEVVQLLTAHFGKKILDAKGAISRSALAAQVFETNDGGANLRFLEEVTHPRITARLEQALSAASIEWSQQWDRPTPSNLQEDNAPMQGGNGEEAHEGNIKMGEASANSSAWDSKANAAASWLRKVFILDAAVLDKAGWSKYCSDLIFVDAAWDLRLARAKQRGWTAEEFEARENSQASLLLKQSLCAAKISTDGPNDAVREQVLALWRIWTQPPPQID